LLIVILSFLAAFTVPRLPSYPSAFLFVLPFLHESFESAHAFFHVAHTRSRDRQHPRSQKSHRTIDFCLMFASDKCARNWLPWSTWIQPLPSLAPTNAAVIVGVGSRVEQGTEPQVCAARLHGQRNPKRPGTAHSKLSNSWRKATSLPDGRLG